MPASPLDSSPYEVLGVPADADEETLKKAYRRMLRHTHPDTGGDSRRFLAVQLAWELVGTPEARAGYDRGQRGGASGGPGEAGGGWAPRAPRPRRDSRPQTRSHGYPGGRHREAYLTLMREWRGRSLTDPDDGVDLYDPALVSRAPREIRRHLAEALAEEATARIVAPLGIAYTVWHDLEVDPEGRQKLDHLILGPSGLIAVASEDWGAAVKLKQGEIVGEALAPGEKPAHDLSAVARFVTRPARVRLTALVIVVPDDAHEDSLTPLGRYKGVPAFLVHRSRLGGALRMGFTGAPPLGGTEIFEVRTRLQQAVRLLE